MRRFVITDEKGLAKEDAQPSDYGFCNTCRLPCMDYEAGKRKKICNRCERGKLPSQRYYELCSGAGPETRAILGILDDLFGESK